jgi:aspartyl-tRNA(Asn)/glutamyl-tRNA(Gln) amidotransferase subunit A
MSRQDLPFASLAELSREIHAGRLSPVELTEALLQRAEGLDSRLNAFRLITRDRATAQAEAAENALRGKQDLGPLHGIPYAVKDLFDVNGLPTTAGCRLLEDNVAAEDCAAVRRLARAGMILLGKTNTVQFAYGGVGINHHHGTPHNPWRAEPHVPGGSSSGSAVAVAAGMVPMALGSDTGGSVRIPSSLCGTVGLKTTVGRISRAGVYPLSWQLDSVGPLARTVEDAALVYEALQGPDPGDEATVGVPAGPVLETLKRGVQGLRLALGETTFFEEADPEVAQAVREAARILEGLGARVDSLAVPEAPEALASMQVGMTSAPEACLINERWLAGHFEELDPVVAHRMIVGQDVKAKDYVAMLRQWSDLRRRIVETLRDVEALLVPTTVIPARPVGVVDATLESYREYNLRYLRNTSIGNILNLCAVSVPCGFTSQGLPMGLMVYAKPFQEEMALRVAWAYEQATDWHRRRPDLSGL